MRYGNRVNDYDCIDWFWWISANVRSRRSRVVTDSKKPRISISHWQPLALSYTVSVNMKIVIIISSFLEHHSKAKQRAPAYSWALQWIKGVVQSKVHRKLRSNLQRVRGPVVSLPRMLILRAWPIHRQHSPSGPILGQSEPSVPSANEDNRWPVRADVSRWCYSLNSPSHGLYRPPVQNYSRFRAVSASDDCSSAEGDIYLWWGQANNPCSTV